MITCRVCGAHNLANTLFCEECGHHLASSPESEKLAAAPPADRPSAQQAPATLHVMVRDSGATFRLPWGQDALIGRRDPQASLLPAIDLTDQGGLEGGVSRSHARITFQEEQPFVQDLGSTNGTWLGHHRLEPFLPQPLHSGVEMRLGKLVLHVIFV